MCAILQLVSAPLNPTYLLLTHCANGDEDGIEATFSHKNRQAIFLL